MSNTSTSSSVGGVGFTGLLAIVFITLKLTNTIDWSWWWVLAPIWGVFVLWVLVVLAIVAGAFAVGAVRTFWEFFTKP